MAVIAEITLRGITREQYDAVRERTGWLERPPEGGLAHLTWWEGEDCHNLDGWESEEAFAAFGEGRLAPAMADLGIDVPPIAVFHPAHEVYTPRAGVVAATETPKVAVAGNADVVRTGYAAFAAGDIPGVLSLFAEDLVWSTPTSVPFGGVYAGPQGAAEFFTKLPQNFAELIVQPERYLEAGDSVVVPGRHKGRSLSGRGFDVPFVHVWTLRNGKVTAFTEVMDSAPVVAALAPDAEAVLRRMFDEIINSGRLDVADELFAEDYVDHGPMGDISGREAFKQLVAQWRDAVPDVHCEVGTVVAQGDLCAWVVRTTGTHTGGGLGFPATGKRFETLSANVGRFRDGRAAEHWSEQGLFPMLVQVGVIPVPVAAG
jgi:ketosteroid isomerase-like protein